MRWLSYIIPFEITKVESSINGEIKVVEYFGKRILYANGSEQSGGTITDMWGKALKTITNYPPSPAGRQLPITHVLVLGLGGGTVIGILKKYYSEISFDILELDPVIIDIAKNYFGILASKNLKIIHTNAFSWIYKAKKKYDLIIFDLYLGKLNPEKARTVDFLKNLKKLVTPDGMVLFNAHYQNNEVDYEKLFLRCQKEFNHVELIVSERYSRILQLK